MRRIVLLLIAVAALGSAAAQAAAENAYIGHRLANKGALRFARSQSWHAPYYHQSYGYPVPLVVPPTAHMQQKWGWGVAQSSMVPIYHQFYRAYPGEMFGGEDMLYPTPHWPSHTDQFGVYYVRGPW